MAWLTGWTRRKSKVVNNLTIPDYQMKLIVHQSGLGPDTSTDIYLGGYIRSDFTDLRFTGPDQVTFLSYWIESISGTSPNQVATVWIKVPTLTPINNIYIYYDNPVATIVSNGTNTFLFFEDFESYTVGNTIIGLNNWTSAYAASHSIVSNDYSVPPGTKSLKITGSGGGDDWGTANKLLPTKLTDDIIVEYDFMTTKPLANTYSYVFSQMYDVAKASSGMGMGRALTGQGDKIIYPSPDGTILTTYSLNTWYRFRMNLLYSTKKVSHYINGIRYTTDVNFADTTATGLTNIYFHEYVANTTYSSWIDNIRIRKYASPEPTFGISGTDELNVTATAMTLDKTSCAGPCTINTYVTWHNYGNANITSFTTAILIDGTTLAYGAPILIPAGGNASSGAIISPILSIGSHTICPYPN